jgi:hypothetical protein
VEGEAEGAGTPVPDRKLDHFVFPSSENGQIDPVRPNRHEFAPEGFGEYDLGQLLVVSQARLR